MDTRNNQALLRAFWLSEITAESLYRFLAGRYKDDDRKRAILEIARMERGHANVWSGLSERIHGVSFRVSRIVKWRIAWAKLISLLLPLTIFIHYLEHGEKKAILDYAQLLDVYRDNDQARTIIMNVIRQEIGHEWHMMEQIADRRVYIANLKEAIPGMTAGIIETLGLVIGLVAAHARTLVIGLTGVIGMVGGMIAETSVSYIGAKGHHDLHMGREKELNIKTEVTPAVLRRELELDLNERGIGDETVKLIMDLVGGDNVILSSLVRTIRTGVDMPHPGDSLKITAIFFIIGAIPILAPFFVASLCGVNPSVPAVVAFVLAATSISVAGFFAAVLAGRSIWSNIVHNIIIIMGTCVLTYAVGLAARFLL